MPQDTDSLPSAGKAVPEDPSPQATLQNSDVPASDLRDILKLAVPAMLAIASEPVYLLADTAMIGRLGVEPLAARAIASSLIGGIYWVFAFLIFGTTTLVGCLCLGLVFFSSYASEYRLNRWRLDGRRLLSLSRIGTDLAVRTGALRFSLVFATGAVARMGAATLSSHEIALQLFLLSSDTTDGIAVAGQTLAARHLGPRRPHPAYRMGKVLILFGGATRPLLRAPSFL